MANIITIEFNGCPTSMQPAYKVRYRRNETEGYVVYPGTFLTSPILVSIEGDPVTQQYEGFLDVYCNGIAGPSVPFNTM